MLHRFTHAKTHRAGGFLQPGEALCALKHKVGPRLFAFAFHTQISLLSRCQVDSLMRGRSARDFGGFADAHRTAFRVPTERRGEVLGAAADKYATSLSKYRIKC